DPFLRPLLVENFACLDPIAPVEVLFLSVLDAVFHRVMDAAGLDVVPEALVLLAIQERVIGRVRMPVLWIAHARSPFPMNSQVVARLSLRFPFSMGTMIPQNSSALSFRQAVTRPTPNNCSPVRHDKKNGPPPAAWLRLRHIAAKTPSSALSSMGASGAVRAAS